MKGLQELLSILLKGMLMGAADVVPGVSGGTIAFITGIYERLIRAIRTFGPACIELFRANISFRQFWQKTDAAFLIILAIGIGVSIFSLAHIITWLLAYHFEPLMAFFWGLILASAFYIGSQIDSWKPRNYTAVVLGALIALAICMISPAEMPHSIVYIFFSAAIAICAMILPGISGSFILILLGQYNFVLNAIQQRDIAVILVFAAGAAAGLLSFSHLLSWTFRHYRNVTLAVLTGFLIGSLYKIWPWKIALEHYTNSDGELMPLVEQNCWPQNYIDLSGQDPHLTTCFILFFCALILVWSLESIGRKRSKKDVREA